MRSKRASSLRTQLILVVCIVTILPFLVGQWTSYQHTAVVIRENLSDQSRQNVEQTQKTLNVTLASYENLLYQLYTDDEIVAACNELMEGKDVAVANNRLRLAVQAKAYAKPYIQAITVLFSDGKFVGYDKLTASVVRSAWMDAWDLEAMFEQVVATNTTYYFPTAYATTIMGVPYNMFHIAHRVIDYRHVETRHAVIVLTIDETMLSSICNENWQEGNTAHSFYLLADSNGMVVSAPRQEMLGQHINPQDTDGLQYAKACGLLPGRTLTSDSIAVELTGWTLYYFQDQTGLYDQLSKRQSLVLWMMLFSLVILVGGIVILIRYLTRSVDVVSRAMQNAAGGDLSVRISENERMPRETAIITRQFNAMMDDINTLMHDIQSVSERQRDAEIAMLEAQINPHFLYNTLDTINWMAIDQDAFDVSNAITALARILRYGIEGSNQVVTVREETEWLKQYLTLQQLRLKNSLRVDIRVDDNVLALPIHKLLLQPFVENAILHGFEGVKRSHELSVSIERQTDHLCIHIRDNGKGMSQKQCELLLQGHSEADKHHIGVRNALERMHMYYGSDAKVRIESVPDEGTTIVLLLPLLEEEKS